MAYHNQVLDAFANDARVGLEQRVLRRTQPVRWCALSPRHRQLTSWLMTSLTSSSCIITLRFFIVRTMAASIACFRSSLTTLSASLRSFAFIWSVLIMGNLIFAFL